MTKLVQIQEKLQSTIVAIRQLEVSMIEHADSPSLHANINSLQKLQRNYEAEFLEAANELGGEFSGSCAPPLVPSFSPDFDTNPR